MWKQGWAYKQLGVPKLDVAPAGGQQRARPRHPPLRRRPHHPPTAAAECSQASSSISPGKLTLGLAVPVG